MTRTRSSCTTSCSATPIGAAESDGALSMLEVTVPARTLIKPHMHTPRGRVHARPRGQRQRAPGRRDRRDDPGGRVAWLVKPRSIPREGHRPIVERDEADAGRPRPTAVDGHRASSIADPPRTASGRTRSRSARWELDGASRAATRRSRSRPPPAAGVRASAISRRSATAASARAWSTCSAPTTTRRPVVSRRGGRPASRDIGVRAGWW